MSLQQPDPFSQLLAAAKCTSRARFKTECSTASQFIRVQACKPTACSCHRMLLKHERTELWLWAWMLWSPYALGTRTESWLWAWMLWSPYALGTRTELWFGHGCSGHSMLHIKKRAFRWTEKSPDGFFMHEQGLGFGVLEFPTRNFTSKYL